jgi:hypothetical protein
MVPDSAPTTQYSGTPVTIPSFKQSYLFVREQPLLVGWTKY